MHNELPWTIFVTQELRPSARAILERVAHVRYSPHERPLTEPEVIEFSKNPDALLSPFAEPHRVFSAKVISALPNLKVLGWVGAGFDHIDLEAATARGIYVTCNDIQSATVADHVFALMLCMARRVVPSWEAVRRGDWEKEGYHLYRRFVGLNVHDKTLGIAGLGRIGAEVMKRAVAFDMRVIYHDQQRRLDLEDEFGVVPVDFSTLLRDSDFLSCNLPLNEQTHSIFNRTAFAQMKHSCIFVNTSRGKCVDTDALCEALKSKAIDSAALDVVEPEPFPSDHPILRLPNFVLVPHTAAITEETEERRHCAVAEETVRVLRGFRPRKLLNPDVVLVRPLPIEP